jgi:chaperonin GroES
MAKFSVNPRGDQVLIRRIEEEKSEGGIFLVKDKVSGIPAAKGEVIAVGPGRLTDDFKRVPIEGISPGTICYFHTYPMGVECDLGEHQTAYLIAEKQIVGVIGKAV